MGVGFKLAVVPFHMWTPDIYQGAPAPVAAFIATVSKTAVVALLLRFFRPVTRDQTAPLFLTFAAITIASMLAGNLLALRQDNVKRILAYSSIAHLGYMLVAFLAGGENGDRGRDLLSWSPTRRPTLAAFGVVTALSGGDGEAEDCSPTTAASAGGGPGSPRSSRWRCSRWPASRSPPASSASSTWSRPAPAPRCGCSSSCSSLTSTIGLYYYTRIIVAMYVQGPRGAAVPAAGRWPRPASCSRPSPSCSWWLGVYPSPLIRLIESAVSSLP